GEVNVLSFEVGGRLGRLSLDVGQRVASGDVLAALDAEQFLTTIEKACTAKNSYGYFIFDFNE
ncbi:MAG: biotin/lipoyl-binding protein, partial [Verrucomicrobiota bacterium]